MTDKDKPLVYFPVDFENTFYLCKLVVKALSRKGPGYKVNQDKIWEMRGRILGNESHTFDEIIEIFKEYAVIKWSHADYRVKKK